MVFPLLRNFRAALAFNRPIDSYPKAVQLARLTIHLSMLQQTERTNERTDVRGESEPIKSTTWRGVTAERATFHAIHPFVQFVGAHNNTDHSSGPLLLFIYMIR